MDLNQVNLIGRLANDPEGHKLASGAEVVNFSLATNWRWKDAKSGELKNKPQFHRLKAWGKIAEVVKKYLKKGDLIYVEGRLEYSDWQDKAGQKKYFTDIVVRQLKMLGGKQDKKEEERAAQTQIVEEASTPF